MTYLVTTEFIEMFKAHPVYSQEECSDPLIITKLFDAFGSATWFLTEYNPEDNIAFCYVTGLAYDEWGYVSLTELESIKHPILGVERIERDICFKPRPFSQVVN